ncbi:hypothetical protein [Phytohabitans houttuyneae]|uniref:Uncharacterized protein n=1 Tax=Phytohabitans houttuyneae TaxID=1076126 RepID=A0A6V8KDS4_9ACTN|nr:hypothetical protein [Phytohabitans houttuyneae]GFJ81944.1 hypothetical protein Phou_061240 [Phytohabitans houttuyneae]
MIEREKVLTTLGGCVGATAGVLIVVRGGSRGSQWERAALACIILSLYLSLVALALSASISIPRAITAALTTAPFLVLGLIVSLVVIIVGLFAVGLAVPVALVLGAINLLPFLSF